mmetsp:Transcript_3902/g.12382  ORF Transcript_3902/g.12382 Transcript_3902/m.12382 type:complete len:1071 (+) Transcript_3902:67-3279(+)
MRFSILLALLVALTWSASGRVVKEAPELVPPARMLPLASPEMAAAAEAATGPNMTEVRSQYGVRVTIWQPPHEVRPEDWERVGRRVKMVCEERGLPLDANTFCVCRLRVPIECNCHMEDAEAEAEAVEAKKEEEADEHKVAVRKQLEAILEEARANRTAQAVAAMEAKKVAMREAFERRQDALRSWWDQEERRVQTVREERLPEELRRLLDRNHAHMMDEIHRRQRAEERVKAAHELALQKADELRLLRERLTQIKEMRGKQEQRRALEKEIMSKQAEVDRLMRAVELMRHDNELRAAEHEEWQRRARAIEERYRAMLAGLGPWGKDMMDRLQEELDKATTKYEQANARKSHSEFAKYQREEEEFRKSKNRALNDDTNARLRKRVADLRSMLKQSDLAYQRMLRGINNVTDETPCRVHQDCGAEQRCAHLHCATVAEGARCAHHEECANEQRCAAGKCVVVEEGVQCKEKRECANWQSCTAGTGVCEVVFEHTRCDTTAKDCANLQVCDVTSQSCRGEYDMEEELERRRREEELMSRQFRDLTSERVGEVEAEIRRMLKRRAEDSDVVSQVQKLADERKKLQEGREALERELQQRANRVVRGDTPQAPGVVGRTMAGGVGGSATELLNAEDEVEKLKEEIDRLNVELGKCKDKPHAYIPTCEADLNFQIKRLREEVQRREALMMEEVQQLKEKQTELAEQLSSCQQQPEGCPEEEQQRLLLNIKQMDDQVTTREARETRDERAHIDECLLKFLSNPKLHQVKKWFETSLAEGCPKIKEVPSLSDMHQCLCADWEAEDKIRHDAEQRAAVAEAARKAAERSQAAQRAITAQKREHDKEVAKEVAKELLYQHLKAEGKLDDLLHTVTSSNPDMVQQLTEELQNEAHSQDKETLKAVSDALTAAGADHGPVPASDDLRKAIDDALTAARSAAAPTAVLDPLQDALSNAGAGRAVQEVADSLAEAAAEAAAVGSPKIPSDVQTAIKDAAHSAASEAAEAASKAAAGGASADVSLPVKTVEKCLDLVESESVKSNLRKAFADGHAANGCSLLSLASNELLRDVHKCLCVDTGLAK